MDDDGAADASDASPSWDRQYATLLRDVVEGGRRIKPHKGNCLEFVGHSFTLANPRDRITFNQTHPLDVVQAIGHWLWTMAGRMEFESIRYYNPSADRFSVDKFRMHGAYGPRLFGIGVFNQIARVIDLIKERNWTRRAVAVVHLPEFDSHRTRKDGAEDEVPCTVAVQYLPRDGVLHGLTYMRSQNVFQLLPLDVFMFTLIQEFVASAAGMEVGDYHHMSGSFHAYEKDMDRIKGALEGRVPNLRSTMPAMEAGDHREKLTDLLQLEQELRVQAISARREPGRRRLDARKCLRQIDDMEPFWQVVVHALLGKAAVEAKDRELMVGVLGDCHASLRPSLERMNAATFGETLDQFDFRVTE